MVTSSFDELQPVLELALESEGLDESSREMVVTAKGVAKAAELRSRKFTLVATNVPFLGRKNQDATLKEFCERTYPQSKLDLATCFLEAALDMCEMSGATAIVVPQNPLFLASYGRLRRSLLRQCEWNAVARLGEHGFRSSAAAGGFTALVIVSPDTHISGSTCRCAIDASAQRGEAPIYPDAKALLLKTKSLVSFGQAALMETSDAAIVFGDLSEIPPLSRYAASVQGASTLDIERFALCFWEITPGNTWLPHQSTPVGGVEYSGLQFVSITREPNGDFEKLADDLKSVGRLGGAWSGQPVWGKRGVACAWMGLLPAALYLGVVYDNSIAAIVPHDEDDLSSIWCFCSSPEFLREVRKINQKTQVANSTLTKVPFDRDRWRRIASDRYPSGLPKPFSNEPTQWLFNGHPRACDNPLQVAVARLLGYQWPRQTGSSFPDCPALSPDGLEMLGDADGIVCLSATKGEPAAAERLRGLLAQAYGEEWSASVQQDLLVHAGYAGKTLDDWLRDGFFEQHCALFHHRPFIWHIWDGNKSGFSALVNYHQFNYATLESLTYAYLGDWIRRQRSAVDAGEAGSDARLQAAKQLETKLKLILEGEPPYDLFVRWKPVSKQAIGWHPDLNDGVRMNIRPFVTADILRKRVKIKWDKDRGKEPPREQKDFPWFWNWDGKAEDFAGAGKEPDGNRWNDLHYTSKKKRQARGE